MSPKPKKHRITTGNFAASRLHIDPEVQRALGVSQAHVRRIREQWNPLATGRLTISKRSDGRLVVIDGMHRLTAAPPDFVFRCDVYEDLTFEEECGIFRKVNTTRASSAFDDFDKGVKAGDPECVAVNEIVERNGLRVGAQSRDGTVAAVAALRAIYARGGEPALDRALKIAIGAWGRTADATDGKVLSGLGRLTATYNGDLDDRALVKKLAKYPGGPTALLGAARGLRAMRPGSVSAHVATIALDSYNHGRRNRLEAR